MFPTPMYRPLHMRNRVVWLSQNFRPKTYTDMVWKDRDREQDERNEARRLRCRYIAQEVQP